MTDAVEVVAADAGDKPILRRLLELHAHDQSAYSGRDVDVHGEFGYPYLDEYWTSERRHPYLVRVDGRIAGFVLVTELVDGTRSMSELFVLRRYRRSGVATAAARSLFARFPGPWVVRQYPANVPAIAFWRQAIPVPFDEAEVEGRILQRFVSG